MFNNIKLTRSTFRSFKNFNHQFKKQITTDQNEINKFDKFSKSSKYNWYTSELIRPLRNLNKLRIPLIRDQLLNDKKFNNLNIDQQLPLNDFKLLDIGCGGGLLSECLSRLGANVIGIDANDNNIKFAREHLLESDDLDNNKLNYVHSDLDNFTNKFLNEQNTNTNDKNNKFDAIIASEILEHVNNVDIFIENCSKLLKDNGLLFITTINQTAQSYLFAILLAENLLNLAPKNTHQYNKLVLLNGLCLLLEENNLNIELIHGMRLNPITKDWSWCEDTSINYALVARKEKVNKN